MKFTYTIVAFLFLFSLGIQAQETYGPTQVGMLEGPIYVPSIAEQIQNGTFKPAEDYSNDKGHPKRRFGNNVIPGKGTPETFVDPLVALQNSVQLRRNRAPLLTFETTTSGATPTDPTGAVGPNHYIAAWNSAFRIFNKDGTPATAAAALSTLFPGNNIGDPIVFYDAAADRFVITEFDNSPNGFNVAVCQGSDPVNDGWHVYTTGFGTGQFPDYTKFSVWADTYMVTANIGQTNRVFAIERNEMLNGNPSQFIALPLPGIVTSGFYSPQAFHTTGASLAPAGTPAPIVYLQDDAWGGVADDHLKIWNATIDWVTPGNSSMSAAQIIDNAAGLTDFISVFDGGSFSNLDQPSGPDIDAMQATIMNQAQYRRFGSHNSVVFNFVVDVIPAAGQGANEKAGIRWYELRQTADGMPWTIFQEGTYTSPTGNKDAFAGSMAMNANGDIGMGYSTVSDTEMIAIQYTGRLASDPLNVMTVAEDLIAQSTANNTNLRYADYTHLTVDPVDNTFWHVSEYFNSNRRDIAGQFQLAAPVADDIGVTSIDAPVDGPLTANEDITVTIRNFGSNDITNPPLQYTINGGTPVIENYSGTITAGTNVSFTFATQADLSTPGAYTIVAKTNLVGDSNTGNDDTTKTVTNTIGGYCTPTALLGCNLDGIKKFVLNTIDADDGLNGCNTEPGGSPNGYADRTALSTTLSNLAGSNVYTLQAQHNWPDGAGIEALSVWIDFDDSGTFEVSERLISGEFFQSFNVLEDFTLTIPEGAAVGSHRLRAKAIDTSAGGDILDPCTDFDFGEVQDYTVVIDGIAGINDISLESSELIIESSNNKQFNISLITDLDGIGFISVYDVLGQTVAFNNLAKEGDRYTYQLDMSYAAAGVYIIKMGDLYSNAYKSGKIIVK
ncbi:MAG: GEVED domain-containing protein [Flavobacteriaceae bacterium]